MSVVLSVTVSKKGGKLNFLSALFRAGFIQGVPKSLLDQQFI